MLVSSYKICDLMRFIFLIKLGSVRIGKGILKMVGYLGVVYIFELFKDVYLNYRLKDKLCLRRNNSF